MSLKTEEAPQILFFCVYINNESFPINKIWVSQSLLFPVLMFAALLFLSIVIAPSGVSKGGGGVLLVGLQLPNKGGHLYCAFVRYRSDKNVDNL